MRAYLAAAYSRRERIQKVAAYLESKGVEIVSTWLQETYSPTIDIRTLPGGINQALAEKDIEEIRSCDTLIFFAEEQDAQPPRGGRHVEFGVALGLGKRVVVVGAKENIFHHLPLVEVIPSITDLKVS